MNLARRNGRRFVLLDRDGTINEEVDHLASPDELRLIPGSSRAIRQLGGLGLGVIVLTNQANIGRGLLAPEVLESIHNRLLEMLARDGASVDAILTCPHAPEKACVCRKPAPGLALEAAEQFGFDLTEAFVVGDQSGDVRLGRTVGASTFLVLTGHGVDQRLLAERDGLADHVVPDLASAANVITALMESEVA